VVFGVDGIVRDRWNLKCSACTKSRYRAHGAPVQCTKGKCPKAFHVTCARDGHEHGLVYKVLQEVEKEVVLLDQNAGEKTSEPLSSESIAIDKDPSKISPDALTGMAVDAAAPPPVVDCTPATTNTGGHRVLKVIKKVEVQILCTQHNPEVAAAKKANKQDKIRQDLIALPPMARIKIRVSAGVFEVSLLRVLEPSKSVEVVWDRGIKREFKWGSVVFGSTDGQMVLQKPAEPAPDAELYQTPHMDIKPAGAPVMTYPSAHAPTLTPAPPPPPTRTVAQSAPVSMPPQYAPYQQQAGYGTPYSSGPWPYQYGGQLAPHPVPPPAARGPPVYYQNPALAIPARDHGQAYSYPPPPPAYPGRSLTNLQWQPSYTGPRANHSAPNQIHYYQYPPLQPQTASTTTSTNMHDSRSTS